MQFANDYEKREFLGRQGLADLQKLHPNLFKYEIHFVPDLYSAYDAYYHSLDPITGSIKKRVLIEIKTRDKVYEDWLLETSKVQRLKKIIKEMYMTPEEVVILYCNFTPKGVLLWNITEICFGNTVGIKKEKKKMNRYTAESRTDKIVKDGYYLKEETAKHFDYVIKENEILNRIKKKELTKSKGRGLYDVLFPDENKDIEE